MTNKMNYLVADIHKQTLIHKYTKTQHNNIQISQASLTMIYSNLLSRMIYLLLHQNLQSLTYR